MVNQHFRNRIASNPYLANKIKSASPNRLILMLYDAGLQSCQNKNRQKASQVLIELISALNFDYKELALSFFDLYRFALDQVHLEKYDNATLIFRGLRDVWEDTVIKNEQK